MMNNLQKQSILVTEILNLGASPKTIQEALESSRRNAIAWLQNDKEPADIIDTTETIRDLSFIINEISVATGKEVEDVE